MSENRTQIYGVSLPLTVAYRARRLAAIQGKSRSGLMRDLLVEYLKKYELLPLEQPTEPYQREISAIDLISIPGKKESQVVKEA